MNRFATEILRTRKNLKPLMGVPGKRVDHVGRYRASDNLILDLKSSVSETYGRWERADQRASAACRC